MLDNYTIIMQIQKGNIGVLILSRIHITLNNTNL
jgi:hypothetical protein